MLLRDRDAVAWLIDAASALDVVLDRAQAQQLLSYVDLLAKWNRHINLTAIDHDAMVSQHLLDCLAIVAPMRRHDTRSRLLDAGSGAGLPGVVIAVAMPEVSVTCAEAVGKKATFIRQMAAELGIVSLTVHHGRVEALKDRFEVITSRALASLAEFVALTRANLDRGGVWMAMKGKVPHEEIADLPADVHVFHVEQRYVPQLNGDRCIVWMRERALT